jgi:hypothetical protein
VSHPTALQFVRFVIEQNPGITEFTSLYDAMARTASHRSFNGLGYQELQEIGISFALTRVHELRSLFQEVQAASTSLPSQPQHPQVLR